MSEAVNQAVGLSRADTVFSAPGEMATLCREFNWESTSLGPVGRWPQSLCTIVNTMLNSRHPMFLFWGPELIQFYNDAYRPSFAESTHPTALGAKGQEFWTDIWDVIGLQIEGVMGRGEATWQETTEAVQTRKDIERARDSAARLRTLTALLAQATTVEKVASLVTAEEIEATGARTGAIFLSRPAIPTSCSRSAAREYRQNWRANVRRAA